MVALQKERKLHQQQMIRITAEHEKHFKEVRCSVYREGHLSLYTLRGVSHDPTSTATLTFQSLEISNISHFSTLALTQIAVAHRLEIEEVERGNSIRLAEIKSSSKSARLRYSKASSSLVDFENRHFSACTFSDFLLSN